MPEQTDLELANAYLEGTWKDDGKQRTFSRLPAKSTKERDARAAVARLLQRRLAEIPPSLLLTLASLFDPVADKFQAFELKVVSRGKHPDHPVNLAIARYIAEGRAAGVKFEALRVSAMCTYGVSRSKVDRAWAQHRRMWENGLVVK